MSKGLATIFGGKGSKSNAQQSSSSQSDNQAYPYLQQTYAPQAQGGTDAFNVAGQLLGTQPNTTGSSALQNYYDSAGGAFTLGQGTKAIEASQASKGLLDSGATGKALESFGQQNGSQYVNSFLQQLLGLSNSGNAAGSIISGAGQQSSSQSQGTSKSSSYDKPGMGKFLGQLAAGGA